MKRRRSRLQVDTFPFLAVLLSTMGALILVLLVFDRRAKIAARARARLAAEQLTQLDEKTRAARDAELEKRRQALLSLELEIETAQSEHHQLLGRAAELTREEQAIEASRRELLARVGQEQQGLAQGEQELQGSRSKLVEQEKLSARAKAELARLAEELARLETTLVALRKARERQQQVYSLVPYKGKHGDNRKPVYVECAGPNIIFHPGRKSFDVDACQPDDVRAEVERRLDELGREHKPYVLMLVRPSGILGYHGARAALHGTPVDFGYELIEEDWALDFGDDAVNRQPWQVNGGGPPRSVVRREMTVVPSPVFGIGVPRIVTGGQGTGGMFPSFGQGGGFSSGRTDSRGSTSFSRDPQGSASAWPGGTAPRGGNLPSGGASGSAGQASIARPGNETSGRNSSPLAAGGGAANPSGIPGSGTPPSGPGGPAPFAPGQTKAGTGSASPPGAATGGSNGSGPGSPGGVASTETGGPAPFAPGQTKSGTGSASPPGAATGGSNGSGPGSPGGVASTETGGTGTGDQRGQQAPGSNGPAGNPQGSGEMAKLQPPSILPPVAGTPLNNASPSPGGAPVQGNRPSSGQRSTGTGEPGGAAESEGPGEEEGDGPRGPAIPQVPGGPTVLRDKDKGKPRRVMATTRSSDWVIALECTADAVVLPTGQRVPSGARDQLLDAVQDLIARRQAQRLPDDPPWRPQIRFQVRPDGLRTYYRAFPALESLGLIMARENLEAAEKDGRP